MTELVFYIEIGLFSDIFAGLGGEGDGQNYYLFSVKSYVNSLDIGITKPKHLPTRNSYIVLSFTTFHSK